MCHNAVFDAAFLRRSPRFAEVNQRFICTMRLAENLIPNCESYALDSLRVRLNLDGPGEPTAAHRAAADVASTCSLLKQLIDRYLGAGHRNHVDGLLEFSTILRMPFGKHRGELLSRVPGDYVDWLLRRDIDDELRNALLRVRRGSPE